MFQTKLRTIDTGWILILLGDFSFRIYPPISSMSLSSYSFQLLESISLPLCSSSPENFISNNFQSWKRLFLFFATFSWFCRTANQIRGTIVRCFFFIASKISFSCSSPNSTSSTLTLQRYSAFLYSTMISVLLFQSSFAMSSAS